MEEEILPSMISRPKFIDRVGMHKSVKFFLIFLRNKQARPNKKFLENKILAQLTYITSREKYPHHFNAPF